MRAFGIELAEEGVEAFLLLQAVEARRPGRLLLEGEVHAFMAAVLLWMPGLDAFDRDAEPEPPHRELGEVEQGIGTGKRHAVVGADGPREATIADQALKGCHCRLFAGRIECLTQQQKARSMIGDGQRIAVAAIAELELTLEVGAPQIVRLGARRQRRSSRGLPWSGQ